MLLMLPRSLSLKLRSVTSYTATALLGFALLSAPWSYRLERNFANPFFPLLNNVFRSPDATVESLRHFRFIPCTLGEALWRPFAMISAGPMVHEELSAPDVRYAVLFVLLIALLVKWLRTRFVTRMDATIAPDLSAESRP